MNRWIPGRLIAHALNPEWGIGRVVGLEDGGRYLRAEFPGLEAPVRLGAGAADLRPYVVPAGARVRLREGGGGEATVTARVGEDAGLLVYRLESGARVREDGLQPVRGASSWTERLLSREVDDLYDFENRRAGLDLDARRRAGGLGAVLGARVMLLPHQLHVARRAAASDRVRLLLADEVGLGKTIEALMIFAALHAEGRAERVLILTPSPLVVQWLSEIWRKFHRVFVMLDRERLADAAQENPGLNPFVVFPHAVASLEWLAEDEDALDDALSPDAAWDLVIVDEAHHLRRGRGGEGKGNAAFRAVSGLATRARSLLLLTATPLQLDPYEHFALLQLLEPDLFPDWERFQAQLADVGAANRLLREAREAASDPSRLPQVAAAISERFSAHPGVPGIAGDLRVDPAAALPRLEAALTDLHPFGDVVISSRRSDVGGFPERVPMVERAPWPEERRALEGGVRRLHRALEDGTPPRRLEALRDLSQEWMRRAASHPLALAADLEELLAGTVPEAPRRVAGELLERAGEAAASDPKTRWLVETVKAARKAGRPRKVLVFTEFPETLEHLKGRLEAEANVRVAVFHAEMGERERDLEVARFRAVDGGVPVMLCTEAGAEGRNFQFCSDLVHFDLPWNPTRIEQRIGRLDRIGQAEPRIRIHWYAPEGGIEGRVARLLEATEVFTRPVGGLDPVLEAAVDDVAALALRHFPGGDAEEDAAWDLLRGDLVHRLGEARSDLQRGIDELLHRAAFEPTEAAGLLARYPEELEEDLADWVVEAAEQIGISLEEKAGPATWFVELGSYLKVDALPGLMHGQRWLGTFDRAEAVDREEIDFLASGHPLVEGLFGLVRDGPYGRVALRRFREAGAARTSGLELDYLLEPPGGRWSALSTWLPATVITLVVDVSGRFRDDLLPLLRAELSRAHEMGADELPEAEGFEDLVRRLARIADDEALRRAEDRVRAAIAAFRADAASRLARARAATAFRVDRAERTGGRPEEIAALRRGMESLERRIEDAETALASSRPQLHGVGWFDIAPAVRRPGGKG